ncbi:MAG: hypothetical protein FJY37_05950 [Betaproteobacteria bacterium]|nr:hypothetical protein [Betaproteobacteria bacterium]
MTVNLQQLLDTDSWVWPDEAGPFLIEMLRQTSISESDLLTAIELAGDCVVASDGMAAALLSLTVDAGRPAGQRAAAAMSLGRMLDFSLFGEEADDMGEESSLSIDMAGQVVNALNETYEGTQNPDMVRRRVLEASVRSPQTWHEAAIRQAFEHPAENWQASAVFCMGYVRGFNRQILQALDSPNDDTRYCAVVAAGNHAIAESWGTICELINSPDTDKDLLLAAINAVAEIRPQEAYEVLHPLLESSDDEIGDAANEAIMMAEAFLESQENDDELDNDLFDEHDPDEP